MALLDFDYKIAASLINCEQNVIKAVAAIESNGGGFLTDLRIKILFEPHIFYLQLRVLKIDSTKFQKANPDICYPVQGTYPYGTFAEQYSRLQRASSLSPEAAKMSCSWGKFQPLGMYFKECGFDNIDYMIKRYSVSEYEHLLGFVRMIKFRKLDKALQQKDWTTFARLYNGAGYKNKPGRKDDYDYRLEQLYNRLNA